MFIMITGTDNNVFELLAKRATDYLTAHPNEIFWDNRWDGWHWKHVVYCASKKDWHALKGYTESMGETYLRESIEYIIRQASPRLYLEYWVGYKRE